MLIMYLDATFDILASPDPLLSVSLSPSQNLYTRRGTLVGVSGKADNVSLWSCVAMLLDYVMLMQKGQFYSHDLGTYHSCSSPHTFSLPKGGLY